jgi:hypothetical protein
VWVSISQANKISYYLTKNLGSNSTFFFFFWWKMGQGKEKQKLHINEKKSNNTEKYLINDKLIIKI